MDLNSAIEAHGQWKVKFRTAIRSKEKLDAATISRDNACALGQWLHGEAKGKYAALKSYGSCVDKHAAFHREAGKVAEAINAGKFDEAEKMLAGATPYASASSAVGGAIVGLQKEAGL
ncbi:MAG TPA: CZB domain-containing protein [Burkholderiaceae bacterium]|nr:CZB domain-containing protein [Burkholderiaceae bacterium]